MSPPSDERDRIRAAMDRILAGTPQASTGALTIVALAHEADVPRNALTQRHTDLRNEFYEKVKDRGATPDVELRLRTEIAKLKKTIANQRKDLAQLRADVPASSASSTSSPPRTCCCASPWNGLPPTWSRYGVGSTTGLVPFRQATQRPDLDCADGPAEN